MSDELCMYFWGVFIGLMCGVPIGLWICSTFGPKQQDGRCRPCRSVPLQYPIDEENLF